MWSQFNPESLRGLHKIQSPLPPPTTVRPAPMRLN